MKITIIQFDIVWEDKKANLDHIQKLLENIPEDSSLVVLPEMFTTGFSMSTEELAETPFSQTYTWMTSMARKHQTGICGSLIVEENSFYYNRFFFVSPDGKSAVYDKRHLFAIGGEDKKFIRGNSRAIFQYSGFRINPVICYDLRFPVWTRNRNDYDLLICVANWPESRREVWKTLLKARAIENQCFVSGVNRIGTDQEGNSYAGDSMVIDPKGEVIASIPEYQEGIASTEISIQELEDFRARFPVWKEADDFEIL
jgi:predicted amidohydrolase